MQRASVTRVYKRRSSQEAVLHLETKDTKQEFSVPVPTVQR